MSTSKKGFNIDQTPLPVSIIVLLIILMTFFISSINEIGWFLAALGLVQMRRWGLLLFTAMVAIGLAIYASGKIGAPETITGSDVIAILIFVGVTSYLWSIASKFR